MSDNIKMLLNLQMARINQRWAQERGDREQKEKRVQTATVLGVDSSMSLNGNQVVLLQNSDGSTQRAASISSGLQPGQTVTVAKPSNSKYGVITSMPSGRVGR